MPSFEVSVGTSDRPIAAVTIYAAREWMSDNLTDLRAGTYVATVDADAVATDLGEKTERLTGSVVAADPAEFAGDDCAPGPHGAVWLLKLHANNGFDLRTPVFVDRIDPSTTQGVFASASIRFCLPPPDVPVGTPGRMPLGARIMRLRFSFSPAALFPLEYSVGPRWTTLATPYAPPGSGLPDISATAEAQGFMRDGDITVHVRRSSRRSAGGRRTYFAHVTGRARIYDSSAGWQSASGATVWLDEYHGTLDHIVFKRHLVRLTPNAIGAYAATFRIPRTMWLLARLLIEPIDEPFGCEPLLSAGPGQLPASCASVTAGGVSALGVVKHLTIPPKRR